MGTGFFSPLVLVFPLGWYNLLSPVLAHLVEDNWGNTHSQGGVMPVKVLVNLGLLLEVSWVPVVGQLVLAHQVLHYCSTTGGLVHREVAQSFNTVAQRVHLC